MKVTRTGKRRAAAINSVKVLLTSASLAATLGGWAVISAANGSALTIAQVDTGASATATVQAWLDSRSTTAASSATPAASSTTAGANANQSSTSASTTGITLNAAAVTAAPTATVAPTATALPTQVVVQPVIRAHSSK